MQSMKVINFLGNKIGSGGIESFVVNMSKGMRDNGIEYIVCVNYKTENIYEQGLIKNGASVVYLREQPVNYLKKLLDYCQYIKRNRDSVLYLHASTPGMYLHAFLAKCLGVRKIVYHVHSTPSNRINMTKRLKDNCLDLLFSWIPSVNVACSKEAGDAFYKNKKYMVVHNGISIERFKYSDILRVQMRKGLGLEKEFVLLQVGRFSPQKNQFFTLNVFKECIKEGMDVKLIFVGEGQYESSMKEYIKDANLEEKVKIILPDRNVERYYMASDLLMFPSEYEGLGIVALEAQVAGLPVLASSCIVDEVCFTDFIERIDLDKASNWVKKIREYMLRRDNRVERSIKGYEECINSGFSDENGRTELLKIYSRL